MRQAIFKLRFLTAVRFGSDAGGGSLTGADPTFHADTLFSALYRALLPAGGSEALLDAVRCGELCFSDAFPWRGGTYFLPRPVGIFARPENADAEDPSRRKLLKKIAFLPVEALADFLAGRADLEALHASGRFGSGFEETRVNRRDGDQPLPYRVGGFRFADDCGLYVIVSGTDEALDLFERGLTALSADGIGGKTSSGWGKFRLERLDPPPELERALADEGAPRQMLLSAALPGEDELSAALEGAYYTVVRRGGFAFSEQSQPLKKRTVYLLGAGSTFTHRFAGTVLDVRAGQPHPVWRCARGLFMGVNA